MVSVGAAKTEPYVIIGNIAGPHGIQGWVKIRSHTRPRDSIQKYRVWQIRADHTMVWQNMQVQHVKLQGKSLLARFEGVKDRTHVEQYMGWDIAIHEQQLPNLRENEFYWRDLIGLRVINQNNQNFGVVDHIIETGANDVLVIKEDHTPSAKERLIPYVYGQYITSIDIDIGEMYVDWDADF